MKKMNKIGISRLHFVNNRYLMPKCKRSQGHIEMMLSFALFLGAILFIFFYINPFAKTVEHSNELNSVQNKIMNYITANVGRLSVISNYDLVLNPNYCYYFDALKYADASAVYVEDEGSILSNKKQYTIYFGDSDVFQPTPPPHKVVGCNPLYYRLGVFSNQTIISSAKIKYIVQRAGVSLDYSDFKKSLGISGDFSINTTNLNRISIPELSFSRNIPGTVEVESREFPVVAINDSGQANQLIINIKAW